MKPGIVHKDTWRRGELCNWQKLKRLHGVKLHGACSFRLERSDRGSFGSVGTDRVDGFVGRKTLQSFLVDVSITAWRTLTLMAKSSCHHTLDYELV